MENDIEQVLVYFTSYIYVKWDSSTFPSSSWDVLKLPFKHEELVFLGH